MQHLQLACIEMTKCEYSFMTQLVQLQVLPYLVQCLSRKPRSSMKIEIHPTRPSKTSDLKYHVTMIMHTGRVPKLKYTEGHCEE